MGDWRGTCRGRGGRQTAGIYGRSCSAADPSSYGVVASAPPFPGFGANGRVPHYLGGCFFGYFVGIGFRVWLVPRRQRSRYGVDGVALHSGRHGCANGAWFLWRTSSSGSCHSDFSGHWHARRCVSVGGHGRPVATAQAAVFPGAGISCRGIMCPSTAFLVCAVGGAATAPDRRSCPLRSPCGVDHRHHVVLRCGQPVLAQ